MSTDEKEQVQKAAGRVREGLDDAARAGDRVAAKSTDLALAFGSLGLAAASAAFSLTKFRQLLSPPGE